MKPRSRGKEDRRVRAHDVKNRRVSGGGEAPFLPGRGTEGGVQHARTHECALGRDREHEWIYTYTTYIYTQDMRARIVGRMG